MSEHDIMARLKTETADLHHRAESRPLQRSMGKGDIPRPLYGGYLSQLRLVHEKLEAALRAGAPSHPAIATVFHPYQERVADLDRDLEFLGVTTRDAVPGTTTLVTELERLASERPVALLGPLYVLEGSTNGSRFLAKALARTLDLEPGEPGLCYLDPYGDEQPKKWAQFKKDMTACELSDDDRDAIVDASSAMFRAIMEISDEVERGELSVGVAS